MKNINILSFKKQENSTDVLTELLKNGAKQLIHDAVAAELQEFISKHQSYREDGKAVIVRNCYLT